MLNDDKQKHFTFTFKVDPELNDGYDIAFKQGDETWWWYDKEGDKFQGPAAGGTPNFTGATFESLYQWTEKLL